MMPGFFLFAAWPLRDLCECKISDNRSGEGSAQKDAKITKNQIGKRLD
jgi:hypothetical protein